MWQFIEPLLPGLKRLGRKIDSSRREILNAIFASLPKWVRPAIPVVSTGSSQTCMGSVHLVHSCIDDCTPTFNSSLHRTSLIVVVECLSLSTPNLMRLLGQPRRVRQRPLSSHFTTSHSRCRDDSESIARDWLLAAAKAPDMPSPSEWKPSHRAGLC